MNEFQNYRPQEWLEDGVIVIVAQARPSKPRFIARRKSEGWRAAALGAVFAFSTLLGSTAMTVAMPLPDAAAVRRVALGETTDASYLSAAGHFDVSPQYWTKILPKIRTWRPVRPDDESPYPEPFI